MVDAAQWAPSDDQARAIIAAVFQQRLVRLDDVERVLAYARRARRRSVITAAVDDAAAGAHSLPESEFLRLCQRNQLPGPDLQHQRRDDTGRSRFLDAYFAEWGVHVEIDGAQHTDVRQWWADMYKQNSIWIAGDRILRFPAWAVRHQPEEVTAQLRDALSAAGWQPANAPASRQPAARAGKSS
jgi:very-short-patch-repair endonuclease